MRRVQGDFVRDLRPVLRSEPRPGEIAISFVFALQRHEAGGKLTAKQPVIEKIIGPIEGGIGFRGRACGNHGYLVVSYETTIKDFMITCKHDFMIWRCPLHTLSSKAHATTAVDANDEFFGDAGATSCFSRQPEGGLRLANR
ncbi:hypothetical protein [Ensifer sp. SL37]|uniref:hypothetical protein n=1 Tax=Ensifer sp. SL37 TaxID=2995137 RepID=UPI002272F95C|nr:hypothetical protein [Ensifer sp. SL37]MCY1741070.1 hypothetical protein [Ensifer sp. SL37]